MRTDRRAQHAKRLQEPKPVVLGTLEPLFCLAGVCGNRTHPPQDHCSTSVLKTVPATRTRATPMCDGPYRQHYHFRSSISSARSLETLRFNIRAARMGLRDVSPNRNFSRYAHTYY
jgi:hypothetical protein